MGAAPLLISTDAALCGRVERAAAAAQQRLDISPGMTTIGRWLAAATVLIDAAAVQHVVAAGPPAREGLIVVANRPLSETDWAACVAMRVSRVVTENDGDHVLVDVMASGDVTAPDRAAEARVIAVVGACGGAGGSVFAAALTRVAARHGPVLLADVDPDDAGLEVMLGMENAAGACWRDVRAERGRIDTEALFRALPRIPGMHGSAVLLGHGHNSSRTNIAGGSVEAVIQAVERATGTTVADLPSRVTPVVERVVLRTTLLVVVIPADVRGCYAAARVIPQFLELGAAVCGVVRGPSPGGLGADDIAAAVGVPIVAAMRPQPGLARSIDSGAGLGAATRGPLYRAAERVWSVGDVAKVRAVVRSGTSMEGGAGVVTRFRASSAVRAGETLPVGGVVRSRVTA